MNVKHTCIRHLKPGDKFLFSHLNIDAYMAIKHYESELIGQQPLDNLVIRYDFKRNSGRTCYYGNTQVTILVDK